MAWHFKHSNLTRATAKGERTFRRRKYVGFMFGPGFVADLDAPIYRITGGPDHGEVILRDCGDAGDVLLRPGMVLPIEPQECAPTVEVLTYGPNIKTCHLIGLTALDELGAAKPGPRSPWSYRMNADVDLPGLTEVLRVPFHRRRHLRFVLANTSANTISTIAVTGYVYSGSGTFKSFSLGTRAALVAGATDAWHVGGTDSAEVFDEIGLSLTPGSVPCDFRLDADALGELAG